MVDFPFHLKSTKLARSRPRTTSNGQFAVRSVRGDTITLEYNGPRVRLELEVEKFIYVYKGFYGEDEKNFGDSGSFNVNRLA